jgi:hypothetical protein
MHTHRQRTRAHLVRPPGLDSVDYVVSLQADLELADRAREWLLKPREETAVQLIPELNQR